MGCCSYRRRGIRFSIQKDKAKEVWALTNEEFTGLMQQYQRLVYTVCLQFVHEPHTAEDLTQDTFLSAFSAIDRCEPQYYKQWLVRVAANKCKDHLKSAWVRKVDAPGDDALPEPRGAPAPMPMTRRKACSARRCRRAGAACPRPARALRKNRRYVLFGAQRER